MMERLLARGRLIADCAVDAERARIGARVDEEFPDIAAAATDEGIELTGPGLAARILDEPGLRWVGSLAR